MTRTYQEHLRPAVGWLALASCEGGCNVTLCIKNRGCIGLRKVFYAHPSGTVLFWSFGIVLRLNRAGRSLMP